MASAAGELDGKITPPIETKIGMDKDYDYYIAKYGTQPPPPPPNPPVARDIRYQGNLGVAPMEPVLEQSSSSGTPPRPPAISPKGMDPAGTAADDIGGDEALLDLAQLEELHHEAERMKALGNKHMAAQEYTRAYNAYSAALQLSPVGPSSHVFLSNRSAALLSLKRYSAAATDARRAIALAPTFGKAHARLGQALYFLKDYEGAVAAYEDAIHYEPDNPITKTYLEKAKSKMERQREKAIRASKGEEISVLTDGSSIQPTVVNSVATDPNASAAVVQTMGFRGHSRAMSKAVGGALSSTVPNAIEEEDPDFEEALRIQERANRYLANKHYKFAIEEYTAALFLVPDDLNLSPDLHLGRAHALNGSRRHESAKIDANLAIKIRPTPEAYSTLAKSLFYLKDYQGAIDAFEKCKSMLPEGESLSMFDRAYLQKSEAALQEALASETAESPARKKDSGTTPIPKLKPPRFVPREEALSRTPNIPPMPKEWPQQSPRASQVLRCGPERDVMFLSEALGIKLNRGPDGVVRVIDVSPEAPGSPIARQGVIAVGDVIREAAGVDLRRPITNIMWGDTVALIKMAPRPIVLVVAQEINPGPETIAEQRKHAAANALSPTSAAVHFPSNSSGDESVKAQLEKADATTPDVAEDTQDAINNAPESEESVQLDPPQRQDVGEKSTKEEHKLNGRGHSNDLDSKLEATKNSAESTQTNDNAGDVKGSEPDSDGTTAETAICLSVQSDGVPIEPEANKATDLTHPQDGNRKAEISFRDDEFKKVGAEVVFERKQTSLYQGWDNLRWMSYSGVRRVRYCQPVYRFFAGKRTLFWSGDRYLPRKLAVYDEPALILILRRPENVAELKDILDIPADAKMEDENSALGSYLVVESVIEPKTCKIRLSPLTTITSVLTEVEDEDFRRRSCFEIINPVESAVFSAVQLRKGAERALTSFTDSGAFLETSGAEHALQKSICDANRPSECDDVLHDLSWKHQVILGTLHSFVVLGNQSMLDRAISAAQSRSKDKKLNTSYLDESVVDALDESGRTALHYACSSRFTSAVISLIKAGANVDLRIEPSQKTPCHLCALNLDGKSLEAILSINRRPNVVDAWGRTPMYLAIVEGSIVGGQRNPDALDRCLTILESYGGQIEGSSRSRHPVSYLSATWNHDDLRVVLEHVNYGYPLILPSAEDLKRIGISVSSFFQYPVHSCLIGLRKRVKIMVENDSVHKLPDFAAVEIAIVRTLEVLFNCGFEPNERLEGLVETFDGCDELCFHIGFAPIQIIASAALDASGQKESLGETAYTGVMRIIEGIAEFLVKNGARVSLDPPPTVRSTERGCSSIVYSPTDSEHGNFLSQLDRTQLKIQSNKQLESLLGGSRLKAAEMVWNSVKSAQSVGTFVFHTDKLAIEDSEAPGGSDEKSCAVCWKPFGTLMNRKHRCRISRRHVCDECSSKRVIENGEEHRISDGQFLLAKNDETKRKFVASQEFESRVQKHQNVAAVRLDRLEAEEQANRDSLFGSMMGSIEKAVFGPNADETAESHADSIAGLSHQLNQTRDALNQRGEKLNTLADKSDRLVSASQDFASMARELNRKTQNQGLFW